jgi:hypothetical protein
MEAELLDGFCHGEIGGSEASAVWWISGRIRRSPAQAYGGRWLRVAISVWLDMLRHPVFAAAACALVLVTTLLHERSIFGPPALRTPEKLGVTLRSAHRITGLSPVGAVNQPAREFRWAPIATADHYAFEARDVTGQLVWETETREPLARAPERTATRITDPMVIRWRVRAKGANSNLLAQSEQVEVRVIH